MSNLLKDASILLTPTAYENGRMNAIKPSKDLYGSELVTNGDFSNGLTSWTSYGVTSVSSGVVTIGASANSGIFQGILTQGKKYKATIELSFNVLDESSEKITIEHIENKLDEQARDIADYQDAKISITNFYEA